MEVRIVNFPPFSDITIELEFGINYVVGPNASGKSRLIEALKVGRGSLRGGRNQPFRIVEWKKGEYDHIKELSNKCVLAKRHLESLDQTSIDFQEHIETSKPKLDAKTGIYREDRAVSYNPTMFDQMFTGLEMWSTGTVKTFLDFRWELKNGIKESPFLPVRYHQNPPFPKMKIVFLEEPENSLPVSYTHLTLPTKA